MLRIRTEIVREISIKEKNLDSKKQKYKRRLRPTTENISSSIDPDFVRDPPWGSFIVLETMRDLLKLVSLG